MKSIYKMALYKIIQSNTPDHIKHYIFDYNMWYACNTDIYNL